MMCFMPQIFVKSILTPIFLCVRQAKVQASIYGRKGSTAPWLLATCDGGILTIMDPTLCCKRVILTKLMTACILKESCKSDLI